MRIDLMLKLQPDVTKKMIKLLISNIYYLLWKKFKKLSNGLLMDDKTILNHRAGIFIQYFIISRSKNDCYQKW